MDFFPEEQQYPEIKIEHENIRYYINHVGNGFAVSDNMLIGAVSASRLSKEETIALYAQYKERGLGVDMSDFTYFDIPEDATPDPGVRQKIKSLGFVPIGEPVHVAEFVASARQLTRSWENADNALPYDVLNERWFGKLDSSHLPRYDFATMERMLSDCRRPVAQQSYSAAAEVDRNAVNGIG